MKRRHFIDRFLRHLVSHPWQIKRHFSTQALRNIEKAITASENNHAGELRFVVEAGLHPYEILFRKTPKKRAIELFSRLRIWDTAHNNGVLIYLLLADRDVEIVADRGIDQYVGDAGWETICHEMELMFRCGEFEAGVLLGIDKIGALLDKHFPTNNPKADAPKTNKKRRNELSDKPLIL
ncbi:MAG: TPM domain-containing protein [Methylophilaceae bacterium]